jgi:pectate lyase
MQVSWTSLGIITTIMIFIIGITFSIIGNLLKNSIFKRMDKFDCKLDEIQKDNHIAHERIWIEHNNLRERVAKLEK